MLTAILFGLLYLAVAVLVIYVVLWLLGKLGIVIPANIVSVIWVILIILVLIWIVQHFAPVWSGHHLP